MISLSAFAVVALVIGLGVYFKKLPLMAVILGTVFGVLGSAGWVGDIVRGVVAAIRAGIQGGVNS